MRISKAAATLGLAFTLSLLAGCGKKVPECSDPKVLEALKQVVERTYAVQADQLEQDYYGRMDIDARYFKQADPIVTFNPNNLSGFASQKQAHGANYCSAANQGPLSVALVYKVDPQYDGNRRKLLNQVSIAFNQKGTKTRINGSDTLLVLVPIALPDAIDYNAQYSNDGKEINLYYGKE